MQRLLAFALGLSVAAWAGEAAPKAGTDRIAKLCKDLGEGEYGSRSACEQLIQIGEPAMPGLLEALKDGRPQARWWAVAAVCTLATDGGYDAILNTLHKDPNAFVRSTTVYYLRHYKKKGKDVWPEVEAALADKDPEVGRWALRLMAEDGYPDLDKKLRQILASGSSELRSYALSQVRDMGDKGKAYLPLVRQLLGTADPRIRYDALHTSVVLMDGGQLDLLRQTYQDDKDPLMKECALRCVTVIAEPPVEAIELFLQGMASADEKVRDTAAKLFHKGCKQYLGYDAKQPLPVRESVLKKYQAWYQANRAKLQWHPDLRKFLIPGEAPETPEKPEAKGAAKE